MYHCNPARIKSMLSTMPDEDLLRHTRYIRKQLSELPDGNRAQMFLGLYRFVLHLCARSRPALLLRLLAT